MLRNAPVAVSSLLFVAVVGYLGYKVVQMVANSISQRRSANNERCYTNSPPECDEPSQRNDLCPICLQLGGKRHIRLPCTHEFCTQCLEVLFRGPTVSCPMCRKLVSQSFVDNIKSSSFFM